MAQHWSMEDPEARISMQDAVAPPTVRYQVRGSVAGTRVEEILEGRGEPFGDRRRARETLARRHGVAVAAVLLEVFRPIPRL